MTRFPIRRRVAALLGALLLSSCVDFPLPGGLTAPPPPAPHVLARSAEVHEAVLQAQGLLDAPALQAYVGQVGQRVASATPWTGFDWHFSVLDSAEANAFALPGGYVYLTRGVLPYLNSEAELAGVIAHEIGHVVAHHGAAALTGARDGAAALKALAPGWTGGQGEARELEASRLAAGYLARAGYVPQALVSGMATLEQHARWVAASAAPAGLSGRGHHAVLGARPASDARLRQAVALAERQIMMSSPREGRDAYGRMIEGLAFGERSQIRVSEDNLLLHVGCGLALQLPQHWRVEHDALRVRASHPEGDAWLEWRVGAGAAEDALQEAFRFDAGVRQSAGTLAGQPAQFAAGTQAGQPVIAAAVMREGRICLVGGIARDAAVYARERSTLRGAINSLRVLATDEREALKPHRIRLLAAQPGMTLAALAQRSPLGPQAEAQLRLLNGLYPKGEPKPGQLLKIVQ